VRRLTRVVTRTLRTARFVVQDGRIPRPLRWGGTLGLLPFPGPLDEAVLLTVGAILWLFYRDLFREAWTRSAAAGSAT